MGYRYRQIIIVNSNHVVTQVIQVYSKETHCSQVPNKNREGDGGKIRKKPNPLDGYIQLHTTLTLT